MAISININDEWENFISNDYDDTSSEDETFNYLMTDNNQGLSANIIDDLNNESPKCSDIYISTKTKIAYLNQHIDLKKVFWSIPVLPYAKPLNGIIKKQMKFNSTSIEELNFIQENLKLETYFEEHIITSINNPNGRIKFKDIRKVSIGVSKKDLTSYR